MTDETPLDPSLPAGETTAPPVFHFTLVMAEVLFNCELGMQSRRRQFVSKSNSATFPRSRLLQLQELAARGTIAEVKAMSNGAIQKIQVEAVYLLGTIDCGWMTEEEFLGAKSELVAAGEIVPDDTAAPETPAGDNVVPFPGS